MTDRCLFLHVGSPKTGTSALQRALWNSTDALATAGVVTPLVGRQPHVRKILHPLGWGVAAGFVGGIDRSALERLGVELRNTPGERVLLSNEDLAEAGSSQVAAFMEVAEAAGFHVRLVVTARDWTRQLPAEWQELLKERLTTGYETFLSQVRDREGRHAERVWRRQDVLAVCERWGGHLDPARVHVIAVPPASVDTDTVYRLFGEAVGFDPSVLLVPQRPVNVSFGYIEAETLRQLNVALGDRLLDYPSEYGPAVRRRLIEAGALARGASSPIPMPPEHVGWVRRTAEERLAELATRGYTFHGDQASMIPPADVGRPIPNVDGTVIAETALRTLANFAVAQFEAARKNRGSPPRPRPAQ